MKVNPILHCGLEFFDDFPQLTKLGLGGEAYGLVVGSVAQFLYSLQEPCGLFPVVPQRKRKRRNNAVVLSFVTCAVSAMP